MSPVADSYASRATPVRRHEYVTGLGVGLLFLLPLLIYGPFDVEESALGVFSSQLHYQHLLGGDWLFWLDDLGFGTPLPIGHRLDAHPVFALTAIASLRVALSALWLIHIAAMVVYFLRLAAVTGIGAPLRLILLTCYVWSASSVCWFYQNDWVTVVIGWTLYPVLVFHLRDAALTSAAARPWTTAAKLALLFGFLVLNSHPGYFAPLLVVAAVYTLVVAPRRTQVYGVMILALLLCVAVSAERVYYFATEMLGFPDEARRFPGEPYQAIDYVHAALAPLWPVDGFMRLPFIGVVLGVASLGAFRSFRRDGDRHVRACALAFVTALILSLLPVRTFALWIGASAGWLFRDPMVFFGILAGGLSLQRGLDHGAASVRLLAWVFIALQIGQQALVVRAGFVRYSAQPTLLFYRYQGHPTGLGEILVEHAAEVGPRLYLSARAQDLLRGHLSRNGLHAVTDLVFLGVNPVNASFKVVSMDSLYPSRELMHGQILGERDTIANGALLDVLGIDMVLTTEDEGSAPSGLELLERIVVPTANGPEALLLLSNPDAWPRAVLVEPAAAAVPLPRRIECPNSGALCRDFSGIVPQRRSDVTSAAFANGRIEVHLEPAAEERLLLLSTLWRPEWQARSPEGPLRMIKWADAFLGVHVPPGTQELTLQFQPTWRVRLMWLSAVTAVALLLLLTLSHRRRVARRD